MIAFLSIEIHFQTILKSAVEDYTVTKQVPAEFKEQQDLIEQKNNISSIDLESS